MVTVFAACDGELGRKNAHTAPLLPVAIGSAVFLGKDRGTKRPSDVLGRVVATIVAFWAFLCTVYFKALRTVLIARSIISKPSTVGADAVYLSQKSGAKYPRGCQHVSEKETLQ